MRRAMSESASESGALKRAVQGEGFVMSEVQAFRLRNVVLFSRVAVKLPRSSGGNFTFAHVSFYLLARAIGRVAEATAAGRHDAQQIALLKGHLRKSRVQLLFARRTGIEQVRARAS